jgi:hypothetical protein
VRGEYWFTAHDALPADGEDGRPPIHRRSITASHYPIDSHAVRKREPGRDHLDGFMQYPTEPYTVPYGVIVPQDVDALLTPVAVSGTHVGFSTLRMEPCWMALGEAAGVAASQSIERDERVRDVDVGRLQDALLEAGAVLMYFEDAEPGDEHYEALQGLAIRGVVTDWKARLDEPIDRMTAAEWCERAAVDVAPVDGETRGAFLERLAAATGE